MHKSSHELKGGEHARKVREEIVAMVAVAKAHSITPKMAAVVIGSDPSVLSYVDVKRRAAEKLGIAFEVVVLGGGEEELIGTLERLSADRGTHGIVLELPLPAGFDADRAIRAIDPKKDVDGLTAMNLGLALAGREGEALLSATAQACIVLAETSGSLSGRHVALVGKGRTVGKPLIPMLLNRGATLTICHSKTPDLKEALKGAGIVISGVGKAGLIHASNIEEGQIIIDAGTVYDKGKLVGDAAADVWGIAGAVTPVPEGVGPLTTAYIFKNLFRAISLQYPNLPSSSY